MRWDHWDGTAEDAVLVLSIRQAGTAAGPNDPVTEVEVVEAESWVIVALYSRRWRSGGSKLAAVTTSVGVQLLEPLGTRKVCDGAAGGERRNRLAIADDECAASRRSSIESARRMPWTGPLRHFRQSQPDSLPEVVFERSAASHPSDAEEDLL